MKKLLFSFLFLGTTLLAQAQVRIPRPSDGASGAGGAPAVSDIDYSNPKEYEIADISVTGTAFLQPNAMISVSGLKVGDKIRVPGEEIGNAIRKIWDLSIVGSVDITYTKIEGDKIWLNINMVERGRLSRFRFNGIRKGEADAVTEKIKLIKGKIVTDALVKNTQLAVKKYFVDKGFLNTTVNIVQVKDSSIAGNNVALRINVDKKRKVKINEIAIEGNQIFTDKKLRRKLKDTKQKSLVNIFKPSKFIRSKYEEDKQKLIKYYNSQGYRDARILSDTMYRHDDRTINIGITLEEGRKYYYRNITWEGNFKYSDEQMSQVLGLKKGDVYNVEELEKRTSFNPSGVDVTSLYMDDGYLFFRLEPVEVAVEGDSVDIEMRIYEGEQATINKVTLSGNTQTSDHVVLRELRTIPGQKFSRSDIIRTQQEIAALGYFDPEKTNPGIEPNPAQSTVDINWQVEEKPSDQIELSGGWGGFYGFVGTLGLTFNNFSTRKIFDWSAWRPIPKGDGQKLSLRAQASGPSYQTYSATFVEPWLGGKKPQSLSFSVSHTIVSNNFRWLRESGQEVGSFQNTAFTLGLSKRLQVPDDFFSLSNSVSYLIYNKNNFNNSFYSIIPEGISHNLTFNTTLSRYSIDNQQFPTRGSTLSLSVTATPPWQLMGIGPEGEGKNQLVEYHKWMFDSNWYTKLVGKLVLSTRVHFGFLGNYTGGDTYSPFERFVVGGSGLTGQFGGFISTDIIGLRGYDNFALNPRIKGTDQPIGGVIFNKYVMEFRYPITASQAANIYVLGFLEGGNTWINYSEFNPFKIRRAAGVGARIFMPAFGMIGIDVGQGFDPIPGRDKGGRQVFQFSIGQQIR